jgi:hypothetical protein
VLQKSDRTPKPQRDESVRDARSVPLKAPFPARRLLADVLVGTGAFMDWEFYVCCVTNENSIWTRWRWRCIDGDRVVEPQMDFTTLTACKADAVLHGFDPDRSRVLKVDGQVPVSDAYSHPAPPARPAA